MDSPTTLTWSHELRFYVSCCVYYAQACERTRVDGPVPRFDHRPTGVPRTTLRTLLDHYEATGLSAAQVAPARAAAADALALFAAPRPTHELLGAAWPTSATMLSDWQRIWLDIRQLALAGTLATWTDAHLDIDPRRDPLRVVLLVACCGHLDAAHELARTLPRDQLTPVARAWHAWLLDEIPLSTIGALAHDAAETEPRFHPARALPAAVTAALCGHWDELLAVLPPQPGAPSRWGIHRVLEAFARLDEPNAADRVRGALDDMFTRLVPFEPVERTRLSFDLLAMLPIIGLYQTHLVSRPALATIAAVTASCVRPLEDRWQPAEEVRVALRELIAIFDHALARGAGVRADPSSARPFRIWLAL